MPPWPYPRLLAHRGGGAFAPENTIAAIRIGRERGFGGVEFDVTLCADGEPVLMHDLTLDRTTDATGPVAARSWAELARLDAGNWYSPAFAGERIPNLSQVIDYCRSHQVWINVEIKPAPSAERRTGQRVAEVLARGYADLAPHGGASASGSDPRLPLLSSFSGEALAGALDAAPALARGLLCTRIARDWRGELQRLRCAALHCDHRHLDATTIGAVRSAGFWVFAYTVNDRRRARQLARWGIDAMCTDRLDRIDATLFD
jgi:glycerophosphoryl diester phosphodiesterase